MIYDSKAITLDDWMKLSVWMEMFAAGWQKIKVEPGVVYLRRPFKGGQKERGTEAPRAE